MIQVATWRENNEMKNVPDAKPIGWRVVQKQFAFKTRTFVFQLF